MIEPFGLAPAEAIRWLERKGLRVTFAWQDMVAEEHGRAFSVAKMAHEDLLKDVKDALEEALREGTTAADFARTVRPKMVARGWWGRAEMADPLTGEVREVQLGSAHRLRIIYDTNLRGAHAHGRWQRIERLKVERPWLRYIATLDERTRDQHARWHDTVLPVDHPFWRQHYPPNGWRCRCTVQQLSERDLARFGLRPSADPAGGTVRWRNPRTGEVREVPEGVDPGFDYTVGLAGR